MARRASQLCWPSAWTRRDDAAADYPWFHPQLPQFPSAIRGQLEHARNFPKPFNGAALLYNHALWRSRKVGFGQNIYQSELAEWAENLARENEFAGWGIGRNSGPS